MTDESEYEFKLYFVIPSLQYWEDVELDSIGHFKSPYQTTLKKPSPNRIGFMEVLDTYEAACAYCEEINVDIKSIMGIRLKKRKK